jgi:hypothetical protein
MPGRPEPRTVSFFFALFVVYVLVFPPAASAQERYDAGAHVAIARSSAFDTTDTGFGGRFGWRAFDALGAEAEMTFYPREFPSRGSAFSSSRIEGLFGLTVGPRIARLRPFAKLRPGFVKFRGQPTVCILIFPPPLSCELDGRTVFALDVGGGVELFITRRTAVRIDAGDRLVKYPGPSFRPGIGVSPNDFYSHDFRFSAGAGVRF